MQRRSVLLEQVEPQYIMVWVDEDFESLENLLANPDLLPTACSNLELLRLIVAGKYRVFVHAGIGHQLTAVDRDGVEVD